MKFASHVIKALLVLIYPIISFGQVYHPLVDTNKLWSTFHNTDNGKYSDYTKFIGDTIIDGLHYKHIYLSKDTNYLVWQRYYFDIREDSLKRVYLKTSNWPELMLYNFGLSIGDSVHLRGDSLATYILTTIDSVTLLNGEVRKMFQLQLAGELCYDTWIEGIGSLFGVLFSGWCDYTGQLPDLMCFYENDTLKFHNESYQNCYIVTGSHENNIIKKISIYPNPVHEYLNIDIPEFITQLISFEIVDIFNNCFLSVPLNLNYLKIDMTTLHINKGLYFYQIQKDGKYIQRGKIIVY